MPQSAAGDDRLNDCLTATDYRDTWSGVFDEVAQGASGRCSSSVYRGYREYRRDRFQALRDPAVEEHWNQHGQGTDQKSEEDRGARNNSENHHGVRLLEWAGHDRGPVEELVKEIGLALWD